MGKLPQTPRAKKVIEFSMEEARNSDHTYERMEHLLLGFACARQHACARVNQT